MLTGALKRNIGSYDKGTLKPTKTVDKSNLHYQKSSESKDRHGTPEEWQALSNKIFTRWVNQKLGKRRLKIDDAATGFADGHNLVALLEILSDQPFEGKLKPAKMRVQQIDNVNVALEWMVSDKIGVKLSLKPSAENIVDGNVKMILGMLWGVMLKFLKIGDDEELNAQDALLMWLQNQTTEYKSISITNLTSSFHNGLALCALIHKFRPKLIPNFDSLDAKNGEANLQTAFDAAEKFFGLEQYLKPGDIQKLDDKAMAVFLAEFYYGISEQRRLDLQSRRIVKVIRYTVSNDQMKKDYNQQADALKKKLADLQPTLEKLSQIDNTMAGAKSRLDEFIKYKAKHKGELLSAFLSLETLYNGVARRLLDGKRPEFIPTEGCTVKNLSDTLADVEVREGKLQLALYEEYNRQIRLANTNTRHLQKSEELRKWNGEKKLYLQTKEQVASVGSATYQLNVLADFENEFKAIQQNFAELKTTGEYLAKESFEDIKTTHARESGLAAGFEELTTLGQNKRAVLEDDLAREKYAEKVRGWDHDHSRKYEKLASFVAEKKAFLQAKPEIKSVSDAKLALDLLHAYESEKKVVSDNVPPLKKLGDEIRSAKYETKYSVWMLPDLIKVQKREMEIEAAFQELDLLGAQKLQVLKDAEAREEFRESVERKNQQHVDKYNILDKWIQEKDAYLKVKEEIKSSSDAEMHLGLLLAYQRERKDLYAASVPPLKELGVEILTAEYKSPLSSYKFPNPDEVKTREATVEKAFVDLDALNAIKHKRLQDDLAREQYREKTEIQNQSHIDKSQKIQAFIAASQRYLKKKDPVDSIPDAIRNLARIRQYFSEKKDNDVKFTGLQKLGKDIKDAEYKSDLSHYKFPTPGEVDQREQDIANAFDNLDTESKKKNAVLEDDLAREEFREKLRQWNVTHIDKHKKVEDFIVASKVYLNQREMVNSIADAHLNLARIQEYFDEKKVNDVKNSNLKDLGKKIIDAEYKTELSQFKFKTPDEIVEREKQVDSDFANLDNLSAKKLAVLQDDLAREEFRENLRQRNLKHIEKTTKLHEFLRASKQYLLKKDEVNSIASAQLNLARLTEHQDEKKINDVKFADLRQLGDDLKKAEYKTALSSYKFPSPGEIDSRETETEAGFKEIEALAVKKLAVLNDDLAREEFREKLRQWNQDHIEKYKVVQTWVNSNALKYLKTKESVNSISEAEVNLERIRAYFDEKKDYDLKYDALRKLGDEIKKAEYKTALSSYKFPTPGELKRRENDVELAFAELDMLSGEKDEAKAGDSGGWLAQQADQLAQLWGEEGGDDDDDDDDTRDRAAVNARRNSLKQAVALMKEGKYKAGGKLAVLNDDLAREQFKQKLRRWNRQHADKHKTLMGWITENRAYLAKKDPVDSIADAEKNLARLAAYEVAKINVLNVNVSALKTQGQEILTSKHETVWSCWKWETPDEVNNREKEIDDLFIVLSGLSSKKKAILDDDLAREQYRERLRLAAQKHLDTFNNIKTWVAGMTATLARKDEAKSISDANNHLAAFAAAMADKDAINDLLVKSLKQQGADIVAAEYKTDLSAYRYPEPGTIKSREFEIDKDWDILAEMAATRKAVLDADLKRELYKEELRLSFANVARDFSRYASELIRDCGDCNFGFTLQEVTAYADTLKKEEKSALEFTAKKQGEYEKLNKELTKLEVTENVYTKHTPESLNKTGEELKAGLHTRNENYAKELKRFQDNDALCRNFATRAETFDKKMKSAKDAIANSQAALEKQLEEVVSGLEESKKDDSLEQIRGIQKQIEDAKVTNNPHTVLSIPDLEVGTKQFDLFLTTKQSVLEKDIEHKNLRGISKELHAEIDRQFVQFDKDRSGKLDKAEFKACLYSLGEEMGKRQVQAIIDRYSGQENATQISFAQFKEFMINYYGVNDTKEVIIDAFKDIAAGDEKNVGLLNFVPRRMEVFTEPDLQFFKDTAPKTEGRGESWVYPPFVEEVFAR